MLYFSGLLLRLNLGIQCATIILTYRPGMVLQSDSYYLVFSVCLKEVEQAWLCVELSDGEACYLPMELQRLINVAYGRPM